MNTTTNNITSTDLAWITRCIRRIWLDRHGDTAAQQEITREARARLEATELHVARITGTATGEYRLHWPDALESTRAAMLRGDQLIAPAAIEIPVDGNLLHGTPDLLRRVEQPSWLGAWAYLPIVIKLHTEPRRWDRFQLNVERWLLGELQGWTPPGELWLGGATSGYPRIIVRNETLDQFGSDTLQQISKIPQASEPAIWFDNDHCPFCRWRAVCDDTAQARQDIALLGGLRRDHARILRSQGITTIAELAVQPAERLAALPESDLSIAQGVHIQTQAILNNIVVERTIPAKPAPEGGLFLDLETDPVTHQPWAFGMLLADGSAIVVIVGPRGSSVQIELSRTRIRVVETADQGWSIVADVAHTIRGMIVHWGEAEQDILERTASTQTRRALAKRMFDLQQGIASRFALPIPRLSTQRTGGLKATTGWLGGHWPADADHWTIAWAAYQRWLALDHSWDPISITELTSAIAYLYADLEALAGVWAWYRQKASGAGSDSNSATSTPPSSSMP